MDTVDDLNALISRRVAKTHVGRVYISTVLLCLDHGWDGGPVFETMIFEGIHDGKMWRYSTWEEAEEGHKKAVALVEGTVETGTEQQIGNRTDQKGD